VVVLLFVVYLIWGFIFELFLSNPVFMKVSERVSILREELNQKILELTEKLAGIRREISSTEGNITKCSQDIAYKKTEILEYENGHVPIDFGALRAYIGEYLQGWQAYVNNAFLGEEAQLHLSEAVLIKDNWLVNKENAAPKISPGLSPSASQASLFIPPGNTSQTGTQNPSGSPKTTTPLPSHNTTTPSTNQQSITNGINIKK
jgi:hypothetical protein